MKKCHRPPVFVIGSYRSGTSVLTWCIGQHPRILALEETNWIAYLSVYLDNLFLLGTVNAEHSNISSIGVMEGEFYQHFGRTVNNFIAENLDKYIEAAKQRARRTPHLESEHYRLARAGSHSKERWIDGTPENSHFVYGLNRLYPDAKFIHILRNPHDVARSLQNFSKAGGRDYGEEESYLTWMRLVRASVEAETAFGSDKVTRILYSDLVDRPKEVLAHCLEFIDEPFDESCLLPLNKKINSSGYNKTTSPEEDAQDRPYILEASQYYQDLLQRQPQKSGNKEDYLVLQQKFVEFAKQFRLEEIDKLSQWGQALDIKIEKCNERIIELQNEVEELGNWGKSLDAAVAERDLEIMKLRSELEGNKE